MADDFFPLTPIPSNTCGRLSLSLRKVKKNRDIKTSCSQNSKTTNSNDSKADPEPDAADHCHPMVQVPISMLNGVRLKCIAELKGPVPPSETTKCSENGLETINISSDDDDEHFQQRKPKIEPLSTPARRRRRRSSVATPKTPASNPRKKGLKTDIKIEKITTVRKLTRSTNLKTFPSKYMPANQQSIHKYFKTLDQSDRIGYFETFEKSTIQKISPTQKKVQPINLNGKFAPEDCVKENANPADSLIDDETRENIPILFKFLETCSRADSLQDFDEFRNTFSISHAKSSSKQPSMQEDANSINNNANFNTHSVNLNSSSANSPPRHSTSSSSGPILPVINRVRKRLAFSTTEETISENVSDIEVIDLSELGTPEERTVSSCSASVSNAPPPNSKRKNGRSNGKTTPIKKAKRKRAQCPAYKIVENTTFAVDAFRYGDIEGVTHYFLTHFHADHYIGLSKKFKNRVYMSEISARLVVTFLRTSPEYIRVVEISTPVVINDVEVIAIDANHCPGALMFIFKFKTGLCTLHTGDFRASPDMEEDPIFWNNTIHTIYLDTTYLSSKYILKPQCQSIFDAICAIDDFREKHIGEKVLYIFGSYVIGKERMWSEIAERYGLKVWTDDNRRKALDAIKKEQFLKHLVGNPHDAEMHILTIGNVSYDYLREYLKQFCEFTTILAIRASGWEKNSKPQFRGQINIIGIEYSEHSSYDELRRFVRFLQPSKIISTVPSGSDLSKTSEIPRSWYMNELRPCQQGYQTSITNFIHLNGSNKDLPPSTSRLMKDIDDAKRYDSADELTTHDATLTPIATENCKDQQASEATSDWLP